MGDLSEVTVEEITVSESAMSNKTWRATKGPITHTNVSNCPVSSSQCMISFV